MDDRYIMTTIQLFQVDGGNERRCIQFTQSCLDLGAELIDPVFLVPEVPESAPDKDVQPGQMGFHFLAQYITLHNSFAFRDQVDHIVWVRVTRGLGHEVLLNVSKSHLKKELTRTVQF